MRTVARVLVATVLVAGCGGAAGTPPPGTASTPTSIPSGAAEAPTLPYSAPLTAGTYSLDRELGITVDVPDGWETCCGGVIAKSDFAALLFGSFTDIVVYTDPCDWADGGQSEPRDPAAIAATLAAQRDRKASEPRAVTVGAAPGFHVRVSVPLDQPATRSGENWSFTGCDGGEYRSFADAEGARYHQAPGQIDDFYFVDLGTRTLVFDILTGPDTPASDKADLEGMIASVRID